MAQDVCIKNSITFTIQKFFKISISLINTRELELSFNLKIQFIAESFQLSHWGGFSTTHKIFFIFALTREGSAEFISWLTQHMWETLIRRFATNFRSDENFTNPIMTRRNNIFNGDFNEQWWISEEWSNCKQRK